MSFFYSMKETNLILAMMNNSPWNDQSRTAGVISYIYMYVLCTRNHFSSVFIVALKTIKIIRKVEKILSQEEKGIKGGKL